MSPRPFPILKAPTLGTAGLVAKGIGKKRKVEVIGIDSE